MSNEQSNGPRNIIWLAVILLVILHQDFWFWDTYEPLVFGFMPIGFAYHIGISIAASIVWFFATKFCFPVEAQEAKAEGDQE